MFCIAQLDVGGEWGLEIGGKLGEYRDDISLFRKVLESFKARLYWDAGHGGRMGRNFKF